MARDYSQVNVAIWGDPDFRALPWQAQHLYMLLWTSPGLSYCGTHDWRPARILGLATGWTRADVEAAAACLAARHFIVVDDEMEEVLLRSWLRFDGLLKQPRMAVSSVNAYSSVASPLIRSVIVSELHRIRDDHPEMKAWGDDRMIAALDHPRAEPKGWPVPEDPFGGSFGGSFTPGLTHGVRGSFTHPLPESKGSVWGSPTPAPTPTPLLPTPKEGGELVEEVASEDDAPRRATRLPDSWEPTEEHRARALRDGVDIDREVEKFRLHHQEKRTTSPSWNGRFAQWLIRAAEYAARDAARPAPRDRHADNLAVVRSIAIRDGVIPPDDMLQIGAP